jgi:hypothetical protein
LKKALRLTTISFPVFSGLLATLIAPAAAAPDEIPTCKEHATTFSIEIESHKDLQRRTKKNYSRNGVQKVPKEPVQAILTNYRTSKPSFKASNLAVSMASSLDT